MSMTQIAFVRKANLPTNGEIQDAIRKLGYDFQLIGEREKQLGNDGLECTINGHETYFETYVDDAQEVLKESDWIKPDIRDQDTAISFIWGADFAAGACIGLISVALIDLGEALIYYLDDQMKYSREALLADTPVFLKELEKRDKIENLRRQTPTIAASSPDTGKSFWDKLKNFFS